ncbi:transketolase, partial [Enterococcus casseliflavus]|nr:transketolase [Enterococcus casseliflavus]MDB1703573.1 transketolase [Enterococcus casseliflavus]MDB1706885.1 transketolase [Enterococcus casseliflavus]
LFEAQSSEYKESVLPKAVKKRVAIEAASPFGWERYAGCHGKVIAIDHFGASAPGDKVLAEFGFSVENVVNTFKSID